jgi:hypothetical protein
MPKADATGLAPKKSADHNPPAHDSSVREGVASTSAPRCLYIQALHTLSQCAKSKSSPISLVKSLSGGLGPKTRRPPGRLCRAFRIPVFCSSAVGIPLVPTQASILSHSPAPSTPPASQTEKEYEKAAQTKSDDFGENERDALHFFHYLPIELDQGGLRMYARQQPEHLGRRRSIFCVVELLRRPVMESIARKDSVRHNHEQDE